MSDQPKKPFGLQSFIQLNGRWTLPAKPKKKRRKHTCITSWCQRDPPEGKSRCYTRASRIWRANNPLKYAFWNLKNRAKQRGHEFTITVEDLRAAINGSDYLENHGRMKDCASIDRIDGFRGYEPGNLRVMTVSENARRAHAPTFPQEEKA
jgi:hypothetical protein